MTKLFISFATEDFITPAHYDVLLRISDILTQRGIRGNFHLTGDFARSLRQRKYHVLVNSLKNHEIGYHGNTHGCYPFIGSVCENSPWDEAVEILMRTEAQGIQDIADITGCKPVYYVLEFVKAPQLVSAINKLGINLIGFSDLPCRGAAFSWYAGSLCFSGAHMGIESPPGNKRLEIFKNEFNIRRNDSTNNVLKIFNHPYKFAYNNLIEAWHDVNPFYRKYTPYHKWQLPEKSLYKATKTDKLLSDFEDFIDYTLSFTNTKYFTTSELASEFQANDKQWLSTNEVGQLARSITREFSYACIDDYYYTPAEIFGVLCLGCISDNFEDSLYLRKLIGPTENRTMHENICLQYYELQYLVKKINIEMDYSGRMPDVIMCSKGIISHSSFIKTLAEFIIKDRSETITFPVDNSLPAIANIKYFKAKSWTRPIYPENFSGAEICRQCKLQTWSYKPAFHKFQVKV